jgi:hypothetical protein
MTRTLAHDTFDGSSITFHAETNTSATRPTAFFLLLILFCKKVRKVRKVLEKYLDDFLMHGPLWGQGVKVHRDEESVHVLENVRPRFEGVLQDLSHALYV